MSAWLLFPEASLPNAPTASHTFSSEGMSYKDTSHKPQGVMPTASCHSIISSKSPDPESPVPPPFNIGLWRGHSLAQSTQSCFPLNILAGVVKMFPPLSRVCGLVCLNIDLEVTVKVSIPKVQQPSQDTALRGPHPALRRKCPVLV